MANGVSGRPTKDFPPGTVFGDLKIVGKVRTPPNAPGGQRYRLECNCGTRITKPRFYLVRQQNPLTHCGCKAFRQTEEVKHTRSSYYAMMSRCYYEKHVSYKDYGGRGIRVCDRWNAKIQGNEQGFKNFLEDMGHRPKGKSLDRYPNVNGNYEPGNCRWATPTQQTLNQRGR